MKYFRSPFSPAFGTVIGTVINAALVAGAVGCSSVSESGDGADGDDDDDDSADSSVGDDDSDQGDSDADSNASSSESEDTASDEDESESSDAIEDADDDGIADADDNCPMDANSDQSDGDEDGAGDVCDECPDDSSTSEAGACGCGVPETDADGDGAADCIDNCPDIPNSDQVDSDGDGKGDGCACDPQPIKCENGMAGPWPCKGMDLVANLKPSEMDLKGLNDNWGWTDPETGYEYALVAGQDGLSFVDMHNPYCPVHLGKMPRMTADSIWRDVKIFKTFAYAVSEDDGGLQTFDLTQLRGLTGPKTWEPTSENRFGHSHNVAINTDTGHMFVVLGPCSGGIQVWDLNQDLASPQELGCWSEKKVHDVHCAVYHGPDTEYVGKEICAVATDRAGDMTLVDMSDPAKPKTISSDPYPGAAYSHQGWMSEDHRYYIHGDELDEQTNGKPTHTYIWDITDLDKPKYLGVHEAAHDATNHNLYTHNNMVYAANYHAGLRVLSMERIAEGTLDEIAYFDTYPKDDSSQMGSTWSVYPYFESGNIIITAMSEGLFIVRHSFVDGHR
jgi:choice-of-anchor B domain-containing protein